MNERQRIKAEAFDKIQAEIARAKCWSADVVEDAVEAAQDQLREQQRLERERNR